MSELNYYAKGERKTVDRIENLMAEADTFPEHVIEGLIGCLEEEANEQVAGRDNSEYAYRWEAINLLKRAQRVYVTGLTEDELLAKGANERPELLREEGDEDQG